MIDPRHVWFAEARSQAAIEQARNADLAGFSNRYEMHVPEMLPIVTEASELCYEMGKAAVHEVENSTESPTPTDYMEQLAECESSLLDTPGISSLPIIAGFISELTPGKLQGLARSYPQLATNPHFPSPLRDLALGNLLTDPTAFGSQALSEPLLRGVDDMMGTIGPGNFGAYYLGAEARPPTTVFHFLFPADPELHDDMTRAPASFYAAKPEDQTPLVVSTPCRQVSLKMGPGITISPIWHNSQMPIRFILEPTIPLREPGLPVP